MKLFASRGTSLDSGGDIFFEEETPKDNGKTYRRYCCYEEWLRLTRIKLKRGEYVEITVGPQKRWTK